MAASTDGGDISRRSLLGHVFVYVLYTKINICMHMNIYVIIIKYILYLLNIVRVKGL